MFDSDKQLSQTDDSSEGLAQISHPRDSIPNWKWNLSITGLLLGSFLYGLDTTISADLQVPIYQTFGKLDDISWVGLGFPMAAASTILLIGRLYANFNTKVLMLSSILIFEAGSAICGAAPNSASLITGRVIAGIGGCGMYQGALSYISTFSRGRELALNNALIGVAWGFGAILGPVIGGGFSLSSASWRWAFYLNLPLCALFAPIYIFIFPSFRPRPNESSRQILRKLDWMGAFLMIPIFVLLMIVVSFAGSTYAWASATTIGLWTSWGVCLVAFGVQQYFGLLTSSEMRLFPIQFLRSRTMVLLFICTSTSATANAVPLFYVPLFFQFTNNDSALMAAVRLLPFICVFIVVMFIAGAMLPILGRYNLFYIAGGVLSIVGGSVLFTAAADVSAARIYGGEIPLAAGSGLTMMNGYAVALSKVSKDHAQDALGFILVAQQGVIALALAMCGCLYQNLGFRYLTDALAPYGLTDDLVRSALAGRISPLFSVDGQDPVMLLTAVNTIAFTISRLYGTVIAAGATMLACGVFMKWEKLSLGIAAMG